MPQSAVKNKENLIATVGSLLYDDFAAHVNIEMQFFLARPRWSAFYHGKKALSDAVDECADICRILL